jgi:DNA-directed RNA polymerase specialized sigma24 family protein
MGQVAPTDVELLEASASGRTGAFAELVRRYQSLICAVSYSATGDRALSEDVAQATFVAAWHRLSDFAAPRSPAA